MKYLGEITNTEDMVNKGYVDVGDSSIPFGKVDSTSTATAYTATVPGITELKDGVCMLLKNGVVTSAAGFTINVNGLGAKPSYSNMAAATQDTTIFNVAYTMLFVYDSTRVAGGCWICYRGYNSDNNTIGYQLRTNSTLMATTDTARYYKIYFTSADNTKWVPASANSTNSATSAKVVNQRPINPFGRIVYTSSTSSFAAGANLTATTIWTQYNLTLGYSFNRTGAALTLTIGKPVYVKCAPQADGSAIIDSDTPTVQDLPTTEDGKIYIYLGVATSATAMELYLEHPVYYYKDGAIRPWTNSGSGDAGYECEEETTALFSETVTATSGGGAAYPIAELSYTGFIQADRLIVDVDGDEYVCEKVLDDDDLRSYGAPWDEVQQTYDWSVCPFLIDSNIDDANYIVFQTAGTYTVTAVAETLSVTTTPCFEKAVKSIASGGGKTVGATLYASDWSNNGQTITVSGVTSNNNVIVSPTPTSLADYSYSGIYCTSQGADSLTFTCDTEPSVDIYINVLIIGNGGSGSGSGIGYYEYVLTNDTTETIAPNGIGHLYLYDSTNPYASPADNEHHYLSLSCVSYMYLSSNDYPTLVSFGLEVSPGEGWGGLYVRNTSSTSLTIQANSMQVAVISPVQMV